ncbi:MAG: alanine racemase [Verrucomicrobia bacterium]|nr:alanine racemase [Verrucomicrobiota bacterium]
MAVSHRVWCTISLSALRSNLRAIRRSCPRGTQILAVVKDNAYGHGLIPVARTLAQAGCEEFGVACASEGEELRGAGIRNPILLLGSTLPSEFSIALQHRLTVTLSSMTEARELAQVARQSRKTALVQVKLDTGMNRLGARLPEFQKLVSFVAQHPNLDLIGTFTHLACADSDLTFTRRQLDQASVLPKSIAHHWANTAAILHRLRTPKTHARPGLGLYGINPLPRSRMKLRPVLSWKSKILLVRQIPQGETISYGATYRARRSMKVATVATGYAHGLPRSLSNRGYGLIHGHSCPILGRVTMDMTLLDVSQVPQSKRGDEVVWLGRSGKQEQTATDMAHEAGTIPWEIFTRLSPNLPRIIF